MNLVTKEKIQNQSSSHSLFVLMFQSSKQTVLQRDVFFQCFSFHPLTYIAIVSTSKALPIYKVNSNYSLLSCVCLTLSMHKQYLELPQYFLCTSISTSFYLLLLFVLICFIPLYSQLWKSRSHVLATYFPSV